MLPTVISSASLSALVFTLNIEFTLNLSLLICRLFELRRLESLLSSENS